VHEAGIDATQILDTMFVFILDAGLRLLNAHVGRERGQ